MVVEAIGEQILQEVIQEIIDELENILRQAIQEKEDLEELMGEEETTLEEAEELLAEQEVYLLELEDGLELLEEGREILIEALQEGAEQNWGSGAFNEGQLTIVENYVMEMVGQWQGDVESNFPDESLVDEWYELMFSAFDPEVMERAFSETIEYPTDFFEEGLSLGQEVDDGIDMIETEWIPETEAIIAELEYEIPLIIGHIEELEGAIEELGIFIEELEAEIALLEEELAALGAAEDGGFEE